MQPPRYSDVKVNSGNSQGAHPLPYFPQTGKAVATAMAQAAQPQPPAQQVQQSALAAQAAAQQQAYQQQQLAAQQQQYQQQLAAQQQQYEQQLAAQQQQQYQQQLAAQQQQYEQQLAAQQQQQYEQQLVAQQQQYEQQIAAQQQYQQAPQTIAIPAAHAAAPAPAPPMASEPASYHEEEVEKVVEMPANTHSSVQMASHLKQQRSRSIIVAFMYSLGGVALVCLSLYLIKIFSIDSEVPQIVTYYAPAVEEESLSQTKVQVSQRAPSAPPASAVRVIASAAPSDVSIPTPEVTIADMGFGAADYGEYGDFGDGQGWGGGDGNGNGSGGGGKPGSFGSIGGSGLKGRLYDFKQVRDLDLGPDSKFQSTGGDELALFTSYINKIHKKKFAPQSLAPYYRAPNELTLTHLAISTRPANEGPKYFGAQDKVKPKGWIAHYGGKLIVPESGRYRFSGFADDYLSVFIDGRPRLHASWPEIQKQVVQRWSAHRDSEKWLAPIGGQNLVFGDWINLQKGQVIQMDIGLGERPGGKLGFILMVEKKGQRYARTEGDKRPILPIFTTAPFSKEQETAITASFPGYQFDWENTLIFPAKVTNTPIASLN